MSGALTTAWLTHTLLLAACHKPPEPTPAIEAPAPAPEPEPAPEPASDALTTLVRALSHYDGAPDCTEVTRDLDAPATMLLTVVDQVRMPPTAPMRAAGCLLANHAAEPPVAEAIAGWVSADDTRGLALLVGQHLDALPTEVAVAVATEALAGPWAADLEPTIRASSRPEVRAVTAPK